MNNNEIKNQEIIQEASGYRKTIYVSGNDAPIFEEGEIVAKKENTSFSNIIAKALNLYIELNASQKNYYKKVKIINTNIENLEKMLFPDFECRNIDAREIFYMKDKDMNIKLLKEKGGIVYLYTYYDKTKIEDSECLFSQFTNLRRFGEALIHAPDSKYCSCNAATHIFKLSDSVVEKIKKEASTIALNYSDESNI